MGGGLGSGLAGKPPWRVVDRGGEGVAVRAGDDEEGAAVVLGAGAEGERVSRAESGLDVAVILERVAARNVNDVLVEAGPGLAAAFIAGNFADEIVAYVAPKILGDDAMSAFALPAPAKLGLAREFEFVDVRRLGTDLRLTLAPRH